VMGVRLSRKFRAPSGDPLLKARFKLAVWAKRAARTNHSYARPPHKRAFLCIQRGEGSWSTATGNGYYGGLQMDRAFMRHYGAYLLRLKGTANRWSPLEQIWTGEHGRRPGLGSVAEVIPSLRTDLGRARRPYVGPTPPETRDRGRSVPHPELRVDVLRMDSYGPGAEP
jgi:hypothetical protein